jgi:hypothetical protein
VSGRALDGKFVEWMEHVPDAVYLASTANAPSPKRPRSKIAGH